MNKIYILDTNVLLHDSGIFNKIKNCEVVVPLCVLGELDKKKLGQDEVAKNARIAIRFLDSLRDSGSINKGIKLDQDTTIRVEVNCKNNCYDLDMNDIDNKIINTALYVIENNKDDEVVVLTNDINLRVKCDALNIAAKEHNVDEKVENTEAVYSGTATIYVDDDIINLLYKDGVVNAKELGYSDGLFPNQYISLISNTNLAHTGVARFFEGKFVKVKQYPNIWGISPKNKEQVFALDALFNPDIKLVTMVGRSGAGKTLLASAAGISQLIDSETYKKIVLTRPVEVMGRGNIGFLPGDENEKMRPWLMPFEDNLELLFSDRGMNYLDSLKESGAIEVGVISFIRGRSRRSVLLIVDEAQNLTKHELKTIITRIGDGSKIVLTGDIQQIDNPKVDGVSNGLSCVVEKFKHYPIAAHITLTRGERSDLATLASEIL